MASFVALKGKAAIMRGEIDWEDNAFEAVPLSATPNQDTAEFLSDLTEIGGGSDRANLGTLTIVEDAANDQVELDCADFTLPTVASGSTMLGIGICQNNGGAETADQFLFFLDTADTPTNGGDIDVTVDTEGVAKF